jgi:hypothetical protein
MKKITLIISFIFLAGLCKAQLGCEYYYPEKLIVSNYEKATDPATKIDAAGKLAMYYIMFCEDSLSDIYIKRAYKLAAASLDPALIIRVKWWDAYVHSQTLTSDNTEYVSAAANELLSYAEKYHFPEYKIAAFNILSWDYISVYDYKKAEKNAISTVLLLEDIHNDSLEIEVYYNLAYLFLLEKDGLSASRYMVKLRDFSEQEGNEASRILALRRLSSCYFLTREHPKTISINKILYEYYARKKNIYAQTGIIAELMFDYELTNDNMMREYFCGTLKKMQDSLNIVNYLTYWNAFYRLRNKMITDEQYIQLLKSNFGNRFSLPKAKVYCDIGGVYLNSRKLDSAEYYLIKAKLSGIEKINPGIGYYPYTFSLGMLLFYQKKYTEASNVFSDMNARAKEKGNIWQYISGLTWSRMCYEKMNDFKKANEMFYEGTRVRDSIEKLNNKQEIAMMEVEKDKEIDDRKRKENEAILEHHHNIQYMGMAIGAIAIILILIILGIINAKPWMIRIMSFFSFIFIFEFIILILDNKIHQFTGGEPWKIILIKVFIIAVLFPLHHFIENWVSHNLIHKDISPKKWIKTIWGSRIKKPEE